MVLHTFGRDLKWNPHIHCLLSEGGYSDDGFGAMSNTLITLIYVMHFRTALLNEMESKIGPSFKKVKADCYTEHKHGFYVYAKPNKCDPKTVVKYIGRYLGRPAIATSRIDKYDGEMVTFHYNRHEDEQYIEETVPAMEFIQRLIRHIPEKHFKMSVMEVSMPAIGRLIPSSIVPFQKVNILFIAASISGELLFFPLSVMTLWNVQTVNTR